MQGSAACRRVPDPERDRLAAIMCSQGLGVLPWLPSAEPIAPGPSSRRAVELGPDRGLQRAERLGPLPGKKLEVAVGLAGPGFRATVEEPQPGGVGSHLGDRGPVGWVQPASLGSPIPGNQQHMACLDGILIQQQHMAAADLSHLQVWLPGLEGIRTGARLKQVLRGAGSETTQLKWLPALRGNQVGDQRNQAAVLAGLGTALQGGMPQPLLTSGHRSAAGPGRHPGSNGRGSGCNEARPKPAVALPPGSCSRQGARGLPG